MKQNASDCDLNQRYIQIMPHMVAYSPAPDQRRSHQSVVCVLTTQHGIYQGGLGITTDVGGSARVEARSRGHAPVSEVDAKAESGCFGEHGQDGAVAIQRVRPSHELLVFSAHRTEAINLCQEEVGSRQGSVEGTPLDDLADGFEDSLLSAQTTHGCRV